MEKEKKIIRKKKGIVVSDKMNKTIVVAITEYKTHPKYLKKYSIYISLKYSRKLSSRRK